MLTQIVYWLIVCDYSFFGTFISVKDSKFYYENGLLECIAQLSKVEFAPLLNVSYSTLNHSHVV